MSSHASTRMGVIPPDLRVIRHERPSYFSFYAASDALRASGSFTNRELLDVDTRIRFVKLEKECFYFQLLFEEKPHAVKAFTASNHVYFPVGSFKNIFGRYKETTYFLIEKTEWVFGGAPVFCAIRCDKNPAFMDKTRLAEVRR